jgi:hypothetical protein
MAAFNFDLVDPAQLTGFVREVPGPATYTLNSVLPDVLIEDIDVAWDILNRTNRSAMFRAYDAETPIGARDTFERRRVSMPPLGVKTVVGELERLRLEQVRSGGDNTSRMIDAIYDDAARNVREVRARMELARGDVITDWKFTLAGENGLTIEADFGMPSGHNPVPTTVWSDHDDSDPIADYATWVTAYTEANGEPPGRTLTSRSVIGHMLQNAKVRTYAGSLAGTPQMVTRQQLNNVMDAFDLPPIETYDTQINVNTTATRPIPADRFVMLPSNPRDLGATFWGVTAESLELAGGTNPQLAFSEAPGLVGVVMKDGDPVRTWVKVTAIGMPILTDPKRLMVADVL